MRIGNGAATQLQVDIYGELMDSVYLCNKYGLPIYHDGWMELTRNLEWLMNHWDQPDEGIWGMRGGRRNYTYSRLMSWVAVERAIRVARQRGLPADIPRWSAVRDRIYHQIMKRGWNPGRRACRNGAPGSRIPAGRPFLRIDSMRVTRCTICNGSQCLLRRDFSSRTGRRAGE